MHHQWNLIFLMEYMLRPKGEPFMSKRYTVKIIGILRAKE